MRRRFVITGSEADVRHNKAASQARLLPAADEVRKTQQKVMIPKIGSGAVERFGLLGRLTGGQ